MNKDSKLEDYTKHRHHFCKLIDTGVMDVYKDKKEVKMFTKLYKSNGLNCPYLLALTKAIHQTNPDLFNRLIGLNGK